MSLNLNESLSFFFFFFFFFYAHVISSLLKIKIDSKSFFRLNTKKLSQRKYHPELIIVSSFKNEFNFSGVFVYLKEIWLSILKFFPEIFNQSSSV